MPRKVLIVTWVKDLLLVAAGAALALLLTGGQAFAPQAAKADNPGTPLLFQQNSPQVETWTTYTPVAVGVFADRVHVQCAAAVGGIHFFAAATNNPAHAARVLSTLSAAQIAGRTLSILYDTTDTSGEDFGCWAADCRRIIGVGFGQ